jgi:hypothetical protein
MPEPCAEKPSQGLTRIGCHADGFAWACKRVRRPKTCARGGHGAGRVASGLPKDMRFFFTNYDKYR